MSERDGGAERPRPLAEVMGCFSRCWLSSPPTPFGDERDGLRAARIFVAGPMSGQPESSFPTFREASAALKRRGYTVEDPSFTREEISLEPWFGRVTMMQLVFCSGIALLPGWEGSDGVQLEVMVGRRLGLTIAPIAEWLA